MALTFTGRLSKREAIMAQLDGLILRQAQLYGLIALLITFVTLILYLVIFGPSCQIVVYHKTCDAFAMLQPALCLALLAWFLFCLLAAYSFRILKIILTTEMPANATTIELASDKVSLTAPDREPITFSTQRFFIKSADTCFYGHVRGSMTTFRLFCLPYRFLTPEDIRTIRGMYKSAKWYHYARR